MMMMIMVVVVVVVFADVVHGVATTAW